MATGLWHPRSPTLLSPSGTRETLKGAGADLQEALDMMLPKLGPIILRVAYIRQNIADLHMQLGEPEKAQVQYLEVLRIWKLSLGEDHPNLAYAYEQLAVLARDRGDFADAEGRIADALRLRESSLGPDHALVLQALSVQATVFIAEGSEESLQKAEETIARAVAIEDALGEAGKRHAVYVLEARAQIAELREDWNAALRDRQSVLDLRIETLGATHRDTAYSFSQVGRMHMKLGRLTVAADYFTKAQALFDAEPGLRDDDGIAMRQGRAEIFSLQAKHEEAIALLVEALARAERAARSSLRSALCVGPSALCGRRRTRSSKPGRLGPSCSRARTGLCSGRWRPGLQTISP